MKAFISAGGKGTRLVAVTGDEIPKPMAVICGKPVLEHTIDRLIENGVNEIVLSVGHLAEKIIDYFGDGKSKGIHIDYIKEDFPLGSAGALYYLKDRFKEDFVVCSGDTVFDIDIKRMLSYHKKKHAAITLFTHPNSHPYDSDLIVTDRFNRVTDIIKKNCERNKYYSNCVNAGFFIVSATALNYFDEPKKVNMEHDFIMSLLSSGERIYAYKSTEYIKDAGTPERFSAVEKDMLVAIPQRRNLKNKQKAVFLDRDGTLNEYKGFITDAEQITLLPTVCEGIKLLNNSEYLAIIISNQPVIARGDATVKDVQNCFNKLETLLGEKGVYIDAIYYCPHHPHSGFKGEIKRLKKPCHCRKPDIGLIERAARDYNIDISSCYMIGDSPIDIMTAQNAHIPSIRVTTGDNKESPLAPTFSANNLQSAIEKILK